jgi:hypothetical protein
MNFGNIWNRLYIIGSEREGKIGEVMGCIEREQSPDPCVLLER